MTDREQVSVDLGKKYLETTCPSCRHDVKFAAGEGDLLCWSCGTLIDVAVQERKQVQARRVKRIVFIASLTAVVAAVGLFVALRLIAFAQTAFADPLECKVVSDDCSCSLACVPADAPYQTCARFCDDFNVVRAKCEAVDGKCVFVVDDSSPTQPPRRDPRRSPREHAPPPPRVRPFINVSPQAPPPVPRRPAPHEFSD